MSQLLFWGNVVCNVEILNVNLVCKAPFRPANPPYMQMGINITEMTDMMFVMQKYIYRQ